jgi:non-heme Fe2+,alpha-ketoglutarate-dependent halogenase
MYKQTFETDGYISDVNVFGKDEQLDLVKNINSAIEKYDILNNEYRCKSHILFEWINKIANHPNIISIVKELIGEDIICLDTMFWGKSPNTEQYVSFHQDGYYWNIKKPIKGVTVWIPFQDTDDINGTIHYLKGSHKDFITHTDIKDENNMLRRGQTIDVSKLQYQIISCPTKLGQVTFHHPYNVHGSYLNNSDKIRLACNVQYVSADSELLIKEHLEYGTLVSGTNKSDIVLVPNPTSFDNSLDQWHTAWYNQRQNYLKLGGR